MYGFSWFCCSRMNETTCRVMSLSHSTAVGPAKDFLTHNHTFKHMRTQSQPELIDRRGMEAWMAAGGHDIYDRASEKAKRILKNHKPQPLPENVCTEIRSIIKETEDELGVSNK